MQQFAESLGLNTVAAKIDIKTLNGLGDCQVIVYLPGQKHFAVLGMMDAEYVRLIDMSSNKFYFASGQASFAIIRTTVSVFAFRRKQTDQQSGQGP